VQVGRLETRVEGVWLQRLKLIIYDEALIGFAFIFNLCRYIKADKVDRKRDDTITMMSRFDIAKAGPDLSSPDCFRIMHPYTLSASSSLTVCA
jgi:hypothetical protein